MTKVEWEQAYKDFDKAHIDLSEHWREFNNGSNKKIRDKAESQMNSVKTRVRFLFRKYPEVYQMAAGGEVLSGQDKTTIMEEFFESRYITGDMAKLLFSIEEKVKSFKDESAGDPDASNTRT